MDQPTHKTAGFTLLEVLVALVLLSVFTVTTWRSLDAVLQAEAHARNDLGQWQTLAKGFSRLESDLENAQDLPLKTHATPGSAPALIGDNRHFRLTRARPDGRLEAVEYATDANRLMRKVADTPYQEFFTSHTPPVFHYMDAQGQWLASWPPKPTGSAVTTLPSAIELIFDLREGVALRRVFRVR